RRVDQSYGQAGAQAGQDGPLSAMAARLRVARSGTGPGQARPRNGRADSRGKGSRCGRGELDPPEGGHLASTLSWRIGRLSTKSEPEPELASQAPRGAEQA